MLSVNYSNKPYILNNKDFKTIQFRVIFPFYRDTEEFAKTVLLPGLLHYLDKKYPTEESFSNECKKLFILSCGCGRFTYSNIVYYSFDLVVPDTYSLKEDLLEKQMEFFSEMIYNPLTENNGFREFEFEREVTNLNKDIELSLKDNASYSTLKIRELVDDDGLYSDSIYNHRNQIDSTDRFNIYDFYLDKIVNNNPIIFVMGNVDNDKIIKLSNKYLSLNKEYNNTFNINDKIYLPPRNNILDIVEESEFKDSTISYAYKVKDMRYDDEIGLRVCRDLLSSLSSRILNKKLRDENDLVYSSSCVVSVKFGLLFLNAFINKDSVDETKKNMLEVIEDLKNEEVVNSNLDKIKDRFRVNLIKRLDSKGALFQEFIITQLGLDISDEEYYEKLLKITATDITKLLNRLVLDTVYFLKEDDSNG